MAMQPCAHSSVYAVAYSTKELETVNYKNYGHAFKLSISEEIFYKTH